MTAHKPADVSKTFELQDDQLVKRSAASLARFTDLLQTLSLSQCLVHDLDKLLEVLRRTTDVFDDGSEMVVPAGPGLLLPLNKDSLR